MSRTIVLCAALAALTSCSNPNWRQLAWGYRVVNWSARLGESFDKALAATLRAKRASCLKTSGEQPKDQSKLVAWRIEMAKCLKLVVKVSRAWTGEVRGEKTGKGALKILQTSQFSARSTLDKLVDRMVDLEAKGKKCGDDPECKKKLDSWIPYAKIGLCAAIPIIDAGIKAGASEFAKSEAYKFAVNFLGNYACQK